MAKSTFSLPILPLLVLLLIFNTGGTLKLANAQHTWCVAKPSSSDAELAANIDFVCREVGKPCKIFQQGGPCYLPNTPINHASVAMNLYYQAEGKNIWNCDFKASGLITITDPSYGNCQYAWM